MKSILMVLATIFICSSCAISKGEIDPMEAKVRDENGFNLLLIEKEKGNYSGSHRFTPFYSYDYNTLRQSEALSVLLSLGYHSTTEKQLFTSATESFSFSLLGLLYISLDKSAMIGGEKAYQNTTGYGPFGALWMSAQQDTPDEGYKEFDAILYGLLWAHSDDGKEDISQVTPFFKYVEDKENKKKIFRLFWFIDIPLGDLAVETTEDEDEDEDEDEKS